MRFICQSHRRQTCYDTRPNRKGSWAGTGMPSTSSSWLGLTPCPARLDPPLNRFNLPCGKRVRVPVKSSRVESIRYETREQSQLLGVD